MVLMCLTENGRSKDILKNSIIIISITAVVFGNLIYWIEKAMRSRDTRHKKEKKKKKHIKRDKMKEN